MSRENRKKKRIIGSIIISISTVAVVAFAIYIGLSFYFKSHFFFQTEVNGLKVGGLTVEETEKKLAAEVEDYLLTVFDRDGNKYHIEGRQIGGRYITNASVGNLMKEQHAFAWITAIFHRKEVNVNVPMEYEKEMLDETVRNLPCFQEENIVEPVNATIEQVETDFAIVPEIRGSKLILENVISEIEKAVAFGQTEVALTDDAYVKPEVTAQSEELLQSLGVIQTYLGTIITYEIEGAEESIGREDIFRFLTIGEDYTVTINEEKIAAYVQTLASRYNTYGDVREFATSSGDVISIGGGDYGWIINKEKEAQTISENILSGESITREPEYLQRAVVGGAQDIGTTYLEIDYTKQHMWYYEAGNLIMESDVVTGNINRGNGSPDGVFKIVYKKSPDVLRGEDYASDVTYFMPFAYNVGVHDAAWRGQFGGEYYKSSGSHGCINAPAQAAQILYENIEVGTPVIAYYREPVELTAENTRIANAYSYVKPEN
ncbi:L,D-transpeptidase/peptidoglycan binding protein [Lachnospiraceae bacterium ZAX-1]